MRLICVEYATRVGQVIHKEGFVFCIKKQGQQQHEGARSLCRSFASEAGTVGIDAAEAVSYCEAGRCDRRKEHAAHGHAH